jgi:cytochrome c oxidase assembly protein subunit 15
MRIAIGFATTVAIWGICYFTLMGPGLAVGELLFGLMLVVLAIGGAVGARCRELTALNGRSGVAAGAWIGFVSAVFNLLIFGSLLRKGSSATEIGAWLLGLFVVSVGLGAFGGAIGSLRPAWSRERIGSPLGIFSFVFACSILLLLVSGGLVTGLEAGLAVPDWPGSFGHNMLLYPLREMTGGIFFEHAHRLYGMLVGTGTITLVVLVLVNDQRKWLQLFAVLLLLMVILQGFMGGYRVTELSVSLAIAHGIFGQVVFVFAALLAAATTARWCRSEPPEVNPSVANDKPLSIALVVMILLQLMLGACLRHLQVNAADGSGIELPTWAMNSHVTVGIITFVLAILVGLRAWGAYPSIPVIKNLGRVIMLVVGVQLLLGLFALVAVLTRRAAEPPVGEVIVTSLHQATGAVLLALAVLLVAWYRRLLVADYPSR